MTEFLASIFSALILSKIPLTMTITNACTVHVVKVVFPYGNPNGHEECFKKIYILPI